MASSSGNIRETTIKDTATREPVAATEANHADLQNVEATTVVMKQSGSEQITADRVSMEQSGAKSIEAKSAQLDQSGVVALGADHVAMLQSSAVQIVTEEIRLSKSTAAYINARQAQVEDSRILLFTGSASGEVHTAFTPVTAAIAGAAFGLVLALVTVFLRALISKD